MEPTINYTFQLEEKVTDRNIDSFTNEFFLLYSKGDYNHFTIDFSNVEWVDNQGLLVLTGLVKYLIELDFSFKFIFLREGSAEGINIRKAKQIIEIWEVWKIFQVVSTDIGEVFDIDSQFIKILKQKYKISLSSQDIYDRYGVTPFLILSKIDKYDDRAISEKLSEIYFLSEVTNSILKENKCYLPFENQTISSIITKELYENFLDHFEQSLFKTKFDHAFMSISLRKKLNDTNPQKTQTLLRRNFEQESFPELKDFYWQEGVFKNESVLQISFLDFGIGIPNTLRVSFNARNGYSNNDSEVLKYSFNYDSSQHPILDRYSNSFTVPRGLFDLLSIVKRFEGLLIARSNYGKVAYDFSNNKKFEEAFHDLTDGNFFPGTLISIYIPERNLEKKFDYSSIKPIEVIPENTYNKSEAKYVNIFDIQLKFQQANFEKKDLYNKLFESLFDEIDGNNRLIYVDFKGFEMDERLTKKIIFFLCSDYRINSKNNVVVINPPPVDLLKIIKEEIADLSLVNKQFSFHPTPFIYIDFENKDLQVFWLGVYSERDIELLDKLLFEDHDLRLTDFESPVDLHGHINEFDERGNLISVIKSDDIFKFYNEKVLELRNSEIEKIIVPCIQKADNSIFLCNGNYYQSEYIQLFEVLSDINKLSYLTAELYKEITLVVPEKTQYLFVGITASSHKILQSLINQKLVAIDKCVFLNNYFSFEKENEFKRLHNTKIILICDVISTGYMVDNLQRKLLTVSSSLEYMGVLIDAIDEDFGEKDYTEIKNKLINVFQHRLKKFRRVDISEKLISKELKVIRINPYTNTPILNSIETSNYKNSILLDNESFISLIPSEYIKTGYFSFNNLIHPYFFDMDKILENPELSKTILSSIFNQLEKFITLQDLDIIFFPKNSGIEKLNFDFLKEEILKRHKIDIIELERFSTNEGWRFPHPPDYLISAGSSKKILILDDGSCSGESIFQMIDEVAFLGVKSIVVLSIIGRVNDHKREFFSRINSLVNNNVNIDLNIFFGSHWHIPTYYLSKSPVADEKNWLEKLTSLPNTPNIIKKIAYGVMAEINPRSIHFGNNKYLLKTKDDKDITNELILVRNEFGKLMEFRFYKEYFESFDNFISNYESRNPQIRGRFPYKLIELFCGVLIHEPYLFENITKIVPDIVEKIQEFVTKLFTGENKINLDHLFYHWNSKNLIHLIFIVNRDDELFKFLTVANTIGIIKHHIKTQYDLNYFLFKLSAYLPIERLQLQNFPQAGKLQWLVNKLLESEGINENYKRQLKIFRSFADTLINKDDFESNVSKVKLNYDKITDDKYHNEWVSSQMDIMLVQLDVIAQEYSSVAEHSILKAWEIPSIFLGDLLRLSFKYPGFFIPYGKNILESLESNKGNLREKYGQLSEMIYNLSPTSDFALIKKIASSIYYDFMVSDSELYKIFKNITTPNFLKEYLTFKNQLLDKFDCEIIDDIFSEECPMIDVPLLLIRDVIFEQIKANMRHANLLSPIKIEITQTSDFVILLIINKSIIGVAKEFGGGKGMEQLKSLNNFPAGSIVYNYSEHKGEFKQEIKLKKS